MKANNLLIYTRLTTERFELRQITPYDCHEIFHLLTDKEVNRYYARPRAKSLEDALKYIEMLEKAIGQDKLLYWGICFKKQQKIIGTICLWNFRKEESRVEIGYELLPAFQGRGYMKEVFSKVNDFAFDVLGYETVDAWPNEKNYPSIRILESNNFKRDIEAESKIDWSKESDFYRTNEELKKVITLIYSLKKQDRL